MKQDMHKIFTTNHPNTLITQIIQLTNLWIKKLDMYVLFQIQQKLTKKLTASQKIPAGNHQQ